MRTIKISILVMVLGLLFGSSLPAGPASAAQDARSAWASVAPGFNFNAQSASPGSTFEENYNGSNLSADFTAAIGATADLMGTAYPPIDPDDIVDYWLMNWPDR